VHACFISLKKTLIEDLKQEKNYYPSQTYWRIISLDIWTPAENPSSRNVSGSRGKGTRGNGIRGME